MKSKKLLSALFAALMIITSVSFSALATEAPEIISDPNVDNPEFVVSSPDSVEKYEWFATVQTEIAITDENADSECKNCGGKYFSSYDSESKLWTGAKMCDAEGGAELFYFTIELDAEERIYINAGPEVNEVKLFDYEKTRGYTPGFSMVGNVFVFDADEAGKYTVSAIVPNESVKISAFKIDIQADVLLENETESKLSKIEIGYIYNCVATFDNDTFLTSKSFAAFPKAVAQPDAVNPTFEVTFADEAKFQWYEIDESDISKAVAGETSKTLSELEEGKTYYCLASFPFGMNLKSKTIALPEYILGDVNDDGAINQYDYLLVKRHYFGTRYLSDDEMLPADVNNDGAVNQYDYILIKRHYFGTYVIG